MTGPLSADANLSPGCSKRSQQQDSPVPTSMAIAFALGQPYQPAIRGYQRPLSKSWEDGRACSAASVSFDDLTTAKTLVLPPHYSAFAARTPRYLSDLSSTADRRWLFIATIPIVFLNEFAGVINGLKLFRKNSSHIF